MKCGVCGRQIRDGQEVLPIYKLVANEKRGDFVSSQPTRYIHLWHMILGRSPE